MVKFGNIYMLEIKRPEANMLTPVLIDNDGELILVDAGYEDLVPCLKKEIEVCGFDISKIDKIILTHQDFDHVGGVNAIKAYNPNVEIVCHKDEKDYIDWTTEPIKLTQRKAGYDKMSRTEKEAFDSNYAAWKACKVDVDTVVSDNDTIGKGNDVLALHIPGHTHGHICIYVKSEKTLITGDAIRGENGVLLGPSPVFTYDMNEAYESLKKMYDLDIERILCYHGGVVEADATKQLRELKYEG